MTRRTVALALALASAGCATTAPDPDAVQSAEALAIAPYAIHEACVKLAAGDRLDWRFASRAPVAFNLHYHDGPSVVLPVTRDASVGDAGVYRAAVAHDYCAMWEAGPGGAVISYRVQPLRGER
ncbi:hypothetical protein BURK1_01308 [Burkholderiales bacterium]|nr:hypothetical protein BURK1_01308 [Burkholderiales bacterium]